MASSIANKPVVDKKTPLKEIMAGLPQRRRDRIEAKAKQILKDIDRKAK